MEFEDNTPVSDEDRRLAEAKKLTLQPMHAGITPELLSDNEIATRHIIEPAIINTTNDTEQMAARVMPTQSLLQSQSNAKPQTNKLLAGIIAGVVIFAGLATLAILK